MAAKLTIEKLDKGYLVTLRQNILSSQQFTFETVDEIYRYVKEVLRWV
jgi:hypothetical protein